MSNKSAAASVFLPIAVAFTAILISPSISAADASPQDQGTPLQEVVVTAEKRAERIQDVPIPVTAVSGRDLEASGLTRLSDYYNTIPGLSIAPSGGSPSNTISIRGITTGANQNPTVGITVDDVPFGASTLAADGLVPDLNPADLAQIEVLRGPQGTLYGAASEGGLIKFVTVQPTTDAVSGQVRAGVDTVKNAPALGYNASGAVNLPVGDSVAVRASAFTEDDAGYIDNIADGQRGVNREVINGARAAGLLKLPDEFSLTLAALVQRSTWFGGTSVDIGPGFGDLQQSAIPQANRAEATLQSYSATLKGKVGSAELVAISGYNVASFDQPLDLSGPLPATPGTHGVLFDNDNRTNKFTQEVRLSMPLGQVADWLVGAYYTHEQTKFNQTISFVDAGTGVVAVPPLLRVFTPTLYQEYAGFTDLTFHVTDKFNVQVGGRESEIQVTNQDVDVNGNLSSSETSSKASVFTFLLTPQYKISADWMAYARIASGYRPGGPNALEMGQLSSYAPDKTTDYEVGLKGDFLEHTLTVDASAYYVDWKSIQLDVENPVSHFFYTTNGNDAKSQGLELSLEDRPLAGLTLSGWVAFGDAELTQALPAISTAVGAAGDRLPYSSRFSGHAMARQEFPLSQKVQGYVSAAVSYVGYRQGEFVQAGATTPRLDLPAYAQTDVTAGVKFDEWTVNVYGNNLTDKRGYLSAGLGGAKSFAYELIPPRTIGLNFIRAF